MNRWKSIVAGCCREPVFWALVVVLGSGIWLYGYEAGHTAAPLTGEAGASPGAPADTAVDGLAPPAVGESAGSPASGVSTDDDFTSDEAVAAPRRLIREADVLIKRGDELILEAGLPATFLNSTSLQPKNIRHALEDVGRRLREGRTSEEKRQ